MKTLIERMVEYVNKGQGDCTFARFEVGDVVMRRLSEELKEITGVDVGAAPDRISYRGVGIEVHKGTGTERIDAVWLQLCLTAKGKPLSD